MPRPPDQPPDPEPLEEKQARSNTTVRELFERERDEGLSYQMEEEPFDFNTVRASIDDARWEELLRRRDEILAELRRMRTDGG